MDVVAEMKPDQQSNPTQREAPSFILYDAFAISHFDRRKAPKRTERRFLDATTVGHVLNRLRGVAKASGPRQAAARQMLDTCESIFETTLTDINEQVKALQAKCAADSLIGELPTAAPHNFPVKWDERRFWLLVRMSLALDEGNRRLTLLLQRGAIDKDEMKRQQRELARPYRAALQLAVDQAAKLERSSMSDAVAKGCKE